MLNITNHQRNGNQTTTRYQEIVTDFIFLSSKITVDGDCNHEIKRHLLLVRKAMKPRQHIIKQRHHFANKDPYSQSYGFSSNHVQGESWTRKKAEHWGTDVFKLWCWKRLLRVLWTAMSSNLSVLKKINPGYTSEGLMLKLKLQYFGHLTRRANSLEKTLMLGKIEGRRRRGR